MSAESLHPGVCCMRSPQDLPVASWRTTSLSSGKRAPASPLWTTPQWDNIPGISITPGLQRNPTDLRLNIMFGTAATGWNGVWPGGLTV
jgi:hypothetical protein